MPDEVLDKSGAKKARAAFAHIPVAVSGQLVEADAVIFGTPTRFGNMAAQMRNSWTRPAVYGPGARSWARLGACLQVRQRNTAGRKRRLPASIPRCCITV